MYFGQLVTSQAMAIITAKYSNLIFALMLLSVVHTLTFVEWNHVKILIIIIFLRNFLLNKMNPEWISLLANTLITLRLFLSFEFWRQVSRN